MRVDRNRGRTRIGVAPPERLDWLGYSVGGWFLEPRIFGMLAPLLFTAWLVPVLNAPWSWLALVAGPSASLISLRSRLAMEQAKRIELDDDGVRAARSEPVARVEWADVVAFGWQTPPWAPDQRDDHLPVAVLGDGSIVRLADRCASRPTGTLADVQARLATDLRSRGLQDKVELRLPGTGTV